MVLIFQLTSPQIYVPHNLVFIIIQNILIKYIVHIENNVSIYSEVLKAPYKAYYERIWKKNSQF